MKRIRIARGLGRRISAWLLALVMIASVISVPAKAAESETEDETVINLISEPVKKNGTTVEDEWDMGNYIVTEMFDVSHDINVAATNGSLRRLEVSVTVNSHDFAMETQPSVLVYAMNGRYGNYSYEDEVLETGVKTYELSLDLTSYTSIGQLALRFKTSDANANVSYTINSAKIVLGSPSIEVENIDTLENPDTFMKDVPVIAEGGEYYSDYKFQISEKLNNAVAGDGRLRLDVEVTVDSIETATDDTIPYIMLYATENTNYEGWSDAKVMVDVIKNKYIVSIDLSDYSTLGVLGMRIGGCKEGSTVTYTINSAKVVGVPAKEGEKEDFSNVAEGDVIAELLDSEFNNEGKATENTYSETVTNDYYLDKTFEVPQRVKDAVKAGVPLKLNVVVTVNNTDMDFSAASMEAVAYAMNGEGGGWTQVPQRVTEAPTTCNLTLDLSVYESVGTLGFRFATYNEGPTINYTIESAQVVVGEAPVVDENAYVTIIGSDTPKESTVIKNPDGNDNMVDHPLLTDAVKTALVEKTPVALEVTVSVEEFQCTSTATPTIVLYAMEDTTKPDTWKQTSVDLLETEKEYTIKLNLADFAALELLGMRFVGCDDGTTLKYIIHSAKIVEGTAIDPYAKATLADPGTSKIGKVVQNQYGPDMIVDNAFVVPHDLTFGLEGFSSLALEVGVTVNAYTPDESVKEKPQTGDVPNGAKVVIYAQDSKYAIWEQAYEMLEKPSQTVDLKLDLSTFINDGTLGALGLRIVDCVEGTTVDYTINYAKVTGEGESLAVADIIDLKYELTGEKKEIALKDTEVGKHGKLSLKAVEGYTAPIIVDEKGEPYQLRGASSHGLSWFPDYVNKDAYQTFRDEWGMNMVRIAVYAREGDYAYVDDCEAQKVSNEEAKAYNDELIQKGVQAAKELGMYVIIDWHVLRYNPNNDLEESTAFFKKYAALYKDYDNVIFEICNEPTETAWYDGSGNDIYTYGTELTKAIRDCGSDALIICGTPSFSAEVDDVATKPLEDKNTLYACHFYAASHYDDAQKKFTDALAAGVPVFISEFGICTASGDGKYDPDNTDKWLDICDENNVSYACWATSNSQEAAAYFKSDCWKYDGAWSADQITTTGKYLINRYRDRQALLDKQAACKHANTELRNVKTANCKDKGYTGDSYCKECDKRLSVGTETKKTTTHRWNEGVVTKEPTTVAKGEKTYSCTICGETKKEEIPVVEEQHEHTWNEGVVTKEPTAVEKGEKTYTCTVCGETKKEEMPVVEEQHEHSWNEGVVTKEPTAIAKGEKTYTCTVCGGTKTEELEALGVPAKGKTIKDEKNKAVYKITKAGTTGATVTYVKPVNKNASTVTIPTTIKVDGITYKVTSIAKNAFKNNGKITQVTIGNNVKSIGASAFYNCKNLKTVKLGNNVTSIGDKAFYKCVKITSITIPSKVSEIGKQAFYNCSKLKTITIKTPNLSNSKVKSNAFKGIYSKATIKVPYKQYPKYKSMLKARGVGSKVKIKKLSK